MVSKLVSIRVPEELLKKTEEFVKQHDYVSVQEFVREAWRDTLEKKIKDYEREKLKLDELKKLNKKDFLKYIDLEK